jgi:hypothetical protein
MGADFKPCINDAVGIWLQCAADARAALAGRLVSAWLSLLRSIPCVTESLNRPARHRVNLDLCSPITANSALP